ncbi:hypothetical protein C5167_002104 [Papaver somniferum]|uniref:Uncharacterized protein n=1 Tax=Papaver somniferum TaxID=3469 RepID=A0A4Y7L0L8_PAPSO|nr:general transcription factor IIF subunit 1-like [Papaver somniferum]RZC77881.1 hypothetical protein C5167_002104 [Papaver somniferum]
MGVFQDEREGYKTTLKGLREQITSLAEDRKILCYREKKAEERISCLQEVIKTLVEGNKKLTNDEGAAECVQLSRESKMCSHPGVNRDEHVSGSMSTEKQSEPLVNLNGDKEKASSLFSMELENKEINIELEKREVALLKPDRLKPAGNIQINKNEDDTEMMEKHTCDRQKLNVSTDITVEGCSNSTKCMTTSKQSFSGQKNEEYGIICKAVDIPLSSSALKRKRLSETVTSDSDEDGKTPISKYMAKKLEELRGRPTSKISPVSVGDVVVCCMGQNVNKFVTTSPQRLVSLRMSEENKIQADGTSKDETVSLSNLELGISSQEKVGNLTTANEGAEVAEETDSDSGGSKSADTTDNE